MDVVKEGEQILSQLQKYKDVQGDSVQDEIMQLKVDFDAKMVNGIDNIVNCPKLPAAKVAQSELDDLAEIVREAA